MLKLNLIMDLSKFTISHHLKELQNADLITYTRNGQICLCKVNQDTLEVINKFVAATFNDMKRSIRSSKC
jgi:DNA-binding transcriptional ArsR family regulator